MARRRSTRRSTGRSSGVPLDVFALRRKFGPAGAIVIVILLLLIVLADRSGQFSTAGDWQTYHEQAFTVVHVTDGDTLRVDHPDGDKPTTIIRFWGIDTPELRHRAGDPPDQPGGQEAKARVVELTMDQKVTLILQTHDYRDKYNRLLAYIILPDGRNLNQLLVEEGLAKADRRFRHDFYNEFMKAEQEAKRRKRGMWAPTTSSRKQETPEPAMSR